MEEDAMPKTPWTVTTAFWMLCLSQGLGMTVTWLWSEGWSGLLGFLASLLLLMLAVYMVGTGRNWARIIFLILVLFSAPFTLLDIIQRFGRSAFPGPLYQIVQLEIGIVAVVLLFQRSSSRWFRAMKKLRTKDEAPAAT
jgi:hypothetical protein